MTLPIIIVGAGEAGIAAAQTLREQGFSGEVLLLSDEREFPYQRPPLSKAILLDAEPDVAPIRPHGWYAERDIDLRLGTQVVDVDPSEKTVFVRADGRSLLLQYGKLLLTTGAAARRFDGPGRPYYLRSLTDGLALRSGLENAKSVGILGGGVIGLEAASAARQLGKKVTVYEPAPRIMARTLSPCVSDFVETLHREAGVDLRLGVKAVEMAGDRVTIEGEAIAADIVIAGIGAAPNTDIAHRAGCAIENGIVVDGQGKTSLPDIYAAGDVASFHHPLARRMVRIETWRHAQSHGAHVARSMLAPGGDYAEIPWFWTDQHGVNLQVAGFAGDAEHSHWRSRIASDQHTVLHFDGGRLVSATTIDNGRDMRPAINLMAAGWDGGRDMLRDADEPFGPLARRLLAGKTSQFVSERL